MAGLHQRPGADLHDQRRLLGDRDEVRRRRHHAARAVPAQQRLVADDRAVRKRHDRLEGEPQLPQRQRALQRRGRPQPLARVPAQAPVEHLDAPAPLGLRPVGGGVGVGEQRVGVAPPRRAQRDPDAGREPVLDPVDVERLVDRLGQAAAERDRGALVDVLADDDELVAAEPRHGVRRAHGRHQPPRERDQQRVARRVAVEVVDGLEVVEVDEQHAGGALVAAGARQRVDQPLAAERAVGQPGQRVVQRVVAHPLLAAQPAHRGREHVRDAAQEVLLVLAELVVDDDADLAEDLVAGADLEVQRALAVLAPARPGSRRPG